MIRKNTKIGDIFTVKLDNSKKKYFQLIAFDLTQLNSDVIRAFKQEYPSESDIDLLEIVNGEVEFYAHCVTKLGLRIGLWEKVGNTSEIGDISNILFRDTNDYGAQVGAEKIKVSENWYVWRINDKDFTRVGKLEGENRKAEIGVVINPYDIVERIKKGKYDFVYPDFE
jgi:hypothetical protein